VDDLIEKGQHAPNVGARNTYYRMAEQIIIDEVPWIPFWHRNDYILKQNWIDNIRTYAIYSIDKGMDIVLSESSGPDN
jgi:ABC-type transport system substrate-binding protein